MKKSDEYKTVLNCSFRLFSKVFITIVNKTIYNKRKTKKNTKYYVVI